MDKYYQKAYRDIQKLKIGYEENSETEILLSLLQNELEVYYRLLDEEKNILQVDKLNIKDFKTIKNLKNDSIKIINSILDRFFFTEEDQEEENLI